MREEEVLAGAFNFTSRIYCLITFSFRNENGKIENGNVNEIVGKGRKLCGVPGPTISVAQGDNLVVILRNGLSTRVTNPPSPFPGNGGNYYHNADVINFHTHGLHVDPAVGTLLLLPLSFLSFLFFSFLLRLNILLNRDTL